jgi:hypothetical protein
VEEGRAGVGGDWPAAAEGFELGERPREKKGKAVATTAVLYLS